MKVLVLNCGSSSIKYQLLDMSSEPDLLAKGLLERIGLKDSELSHQPKGKDKYKWVQDIPDHEIGIDWILKTLVDKEVGVLTSLNEIAAVGHRVAHGGENFTQSALITEKTKKEIEACIELAPLHNPANLKGILAMEKLLPGVPMVAVFDTSFHQTMPPEAYMYPIPYEYYEKYKIRRYAFHGTSHKYVAQKACKILGKDFNKINIITCHLGNGASVAAIKQGKSIDSSMGFTPVEGLMMGTRVGDVDAGVVRAVSVVAVVHVSRHRIREHHGFCGNANVALLHADQRVVGDPIPDRYAGVVAEGEPATVVESVEVTQVRIARIRLARAEVRLFALHVRKEEARPHHFGSPVRWVSVSSSAH